MVTWDLGKAKPTVFLSPIQRPDETISTIVQEFFEVTNCEHGVIIRAIRPVDHVDLTLVARGYFCINLGVEPGHSLPRLFRQPRERDYELLVQFPPQHIAEQIRGNPNNCEAAKGFGPSHVRMSAPSRLVFKIPERADWKPSLRIDELTDWNRLLPLVHERARLEASFGVEEQLKITFRGLSNEEFKDVDIEKAKAAIAKTLLGPTDRQCALEMAGRLILSPSENAWWLVPRPARNAKAAPLWTARLDRTGRRNVRAIWSTRMEPSVIPKSTDDPDDEIDAATHKPMLSLSLRNHWEMVAQTSVYGLPALRRLESEDDGAQGRSRNRPDGKVGGDSVRVPRGGVIRPTFRVGYLDQIDEIKKHPNQDAGIAVATPFDDADISLSALGGVFGAEWKGDPARVLLDSHPNLGFSLERLDYRSYLGRDGHVIAVEKGFLFPLGIRASLITVHPRDIYPSANDDPVSYLIRRKFIVTPNRPRSYPGPYQPFDGRGFPPRTITMKTLVTPALTDPIINIDLFDDDGNSINLNKESLFWPQIPGKDRKPTDFMFEWATEDASSVKCLLVFVRNELVGNPVAMGALVRYYKSLTQSRRTATLGGVRHRYAEPKLEGDTSFDTASWIMSVTGRQDGPTGEEHFAMDGRMEGADQPPFYPMMERAEIAVQSLDQMMGPQGFVPVEYFEDYLQSEFKTKHDHGIFLKLSEPVIKLPASSQANRSGGIASPDLRVAALSRETGLVGGKKARTTVNASTVDTIDFSQAVKGTFDPAQFFEGAKLLGIVELEKLVKLSTNFSTAAPKLIEEVQYGVGQAFELLQDAAQKAKDVLYGGGGRVGLVRTLTAAIAKVDNEFLAPFDLSLGEVYPKLLYALKPVQGGQLENALDVLIQAKDAGDPDVPTAVAEILKIVRALLAAIAIIVKDPVPNAFDDALAVVVQQLEQALKDAASTTKALSEQMVAQFFAWLETAFCNAIDSEGFGKVLFGEQGSLSCEELFEDPENALRALGEGLYAETFSKFRDALTGLKGLENDLRAIAVKQADRFLDMIEGTAIVIDIAEVGRKLQDVCQNVQAAALALGDSVMSVPNSLKDAAQALIHAVEQIVVPADDFGPPLQKAIDHIKAGANEVIEKNVMLTTERGKLKAVTSSICEKPIEYLNPIAAIFSQRRQIITPLLAGTRSAEAISEIFTQSNPSQADKDALQDAIRKFSDLYLGFTGIIGLGSHVALLTAAAQSIVQAQLGDKIYRDALATALQRVEDDAQDLLSRLQGELTPAELRELVEKETGAFQDLIDRKLASFLLQSVGFSDPVLKAMNEAVSDALKALCGSGILQVVYTVVGLLLEAIIKPTLNDKTLAAVYGYALGGADKLKALNGLRQNLQEEQDSVADLANNPSLPVFRALIEKYQRGEGALMNAIKAIEDLNFVDFGQNLTQAVREQLKLIEQEVRALIQQFVPTRIKTLYHWDTDLDPVPSEGDWIFRMHKDARRPHLALDSLFSFDVVTEERSTLVTGTLQPFELKLLGKQFHMATIVFGVTEFRSKNGSVPSFKMSVEDVQIGEVLKYIQALQQWLSPKGSGFYVKPAEGFSGIEAGYIYDAGIIQLGPLQFINVAFKVAAILPFSGGSMLYEFALGDPDRPFLISSPPYGGGGWALFRCDASKVIYMDVAFVFGGVAALKFGPLEAHGRIVAGIRVQKRTEKTGQETWVFTAIFEAVGHGSIACFSISVSIRVLLIQRNSGALAGETRYSFSFKVGFVEISYVVNARYKISNDSAAPSLMFASFQDGDATLRSNVPPKAFEWQSYRSYFDLDLLKDAA